MGSEVHIIAGKQLRKCSGVHLDTVPSVCEASTPAPALVQMNMKVTFDTMKSAKGSTIRPSGHQ